MERTDKSVLVIGAGVAGATAALQLAQAGYRVHLIESQKAIGGHAADMGCKATDRCLRCNACVADEIFRKVQTCENVKIYTETELDRLEDGKGKSRYIAHLKNQNIITIDIDNIVIAAGYTEYDPAENNLYGYGLAKNVITGIEAEKQLAQNQQITRPSDGQRPKRIAFVQCVGSRTEEIYRRIEDVNYCSTVCCSYALRIASLLKYQAEDSQITIFYMDIQNFGKNFDKFYNECKDKMTFVRSRPYEITESENDTVEVKYTCQNENVCRQSFDLVILSVGIRPCRDGKQLADKLLVPIDSQGFFGIKGAEALPDLQRAGIYAAGAIESPKDIAGSISQAKAVCAAIMSEDR